jgi:hypothetical protein
MLQRPPETIAQELRAAYTWREVLRALAGEVYALAVHPIIVADGVVLPPVRTPLPDHIAEALQDVERQIRGLEMEQVYRENRCGLDR